MSQSYGAIGRASNNASAPASASKVSTAPQVQEYTVRLPKNAKKVHHVMRFNATLKVDFAEWTNVKMERENNMRDNRVEEAMPKFGAGSEYNRDMKEELRRKRFGISARKYKPDAQPWILRVGGKNGKKFRGSREGGVGEYASFFVFAHATDGAIEAYPLNEWYNFQPIQRYKALSAEEAEQEFGRRNKTMNFFSLMMQKRLKGENGEESTADGDEPRLPGKKSKQQLRITDADDIMMDSGDESSDSDADNGKKREDPDSDNDKKKAKKNLKKKKSKKQKDSDDEAFEDSDDGDEEGREVDYIESSSDESDLEMKTDKQMKSVAEEDGLRKLLTSDESEDDEEKNSSDESNKEDKKEQTENDAKAKKKKNLSKKANKDGDKKESLSDLSSDSEDSDNDSKKKTSKFIGNSASNSRSASPSLDGNSSMAGSSGLKRKIHSMPTDLGMGGNSNGASENSNSPSVTPAKKAKYDAPQVLTTFAGAISGNKDENGITEDAVRRYLMRKPMTTTELLTKFKNKKTGVSSEKLVDTMTQILKKINPVKQVIQGKMYLSIKNK